MPSDFWDTVAELGLNVGLEWLKAQRESEEEFDRKQMANLIAYFAVDGASEIVEKVGTANRMSVDEFAGIAGIFFGEMTSLIRQLSGVLVHPTDTSIDVIEACTQALEKLRRQAEVVSVTGTVIKK